MRTKLVLLWAVVLFVIDQIIKVVIDKYFLDVKFDIIPPLFYFRPSFNHQYSWINGLFGLGMGFWIHIIIYVFATLIIVLLYDYLKTLPGNRKMMNIAFVFGFAAIMCSFIGTIIWDGCLDYIYLKPLFVFDLKDLYINTFLILFIIPQINKKNWSTFTLKNIVRHYKARIASFNEKQKN